MKGGVRNDGTDPEMMQILQVEHTGNITPCGLNLFSKLNEKGQFELQLFELWKIFIITDQLDLCSSTLKFTYFLFELC